MTYGVNQIEVHEGLEGPRKNPSVYVGDDGFKGFHHIGWEVLDNSMDEHLNGYGDEVIVTLHTDGSLSIRDYGRGIPMDIHEKTQKSGIETVLTMLHAGGKNGGENSGYDKSGGLHGLGVSVTNALSEYLICVVNRDRKQAIHRYERGMKVSEEMRSGNLDRVGTYIRFKPDPLIFGDQVEFDELVISKRLEYLSYLNKCKMIFKSEITGTTKTFHCIEDGIYFGINRLCDFKGMLADPIIFTKEKASDSSDEYSIGIQVVSDKLERPILSFVNNIPTPLGGPHVSGIKSAISKFFNEVSNRKGEYKNNQIIENIFIMLSVRISPSDRKFSSQIKEGLIENKKLEGRISSWLYKELMDWKDGDPEGVQDFVKKVEKKIFHERDMKELEANIKPDIKTTSSKLVKPNIKDAEKNELFIVEGDSAGGSAKRAKNEYQGILPLKGKPINPIRNSLRKIYDNEEILNLIHAFGGTIGDDFNFKNFPWSKVIIMTDADNDGAHIVTLLLSFIFRFYRSLFEQEKIFIACPPLYRVKYRKTYEYFFTDEELKEYTKDKSKYELSRFKGLGEMNPEDLEETTMNPETRKLILVTIEDAENCHRLVEGLMGKDVEERKILLDSIY